MTQAWVKINGFKPRAPWDAYQINPLGQVRTVREVQVIKTSSSGTERTIKTIYRTVRAYEFGQRGTAVWLLDTYETHQNVCVQELLKTYFQSKEVKQGESRIA